MSPGSAALSAHLSSVPQWRDDSCCVSLFSAYHGPPEDFGEAWSHKIKFWSDLIAESVRLGLLGPSIFCFARDDCPARFARKGVFPLGLETVISHLLETQVFLSREDYLRPSSGYFQVLGSISNSLFSLSRWLGQLGSSVLGLDGDPGHTAEAPSGPPGTVLVAALLEGFCKSLVASLKQNCLDFFESCLSLEDLREKCHAVSDHMGIPHVSDEDLDLVVQWLRSCDRVQVFSDSKMKAFVFHRLAGCPKPDPHLVKNICALKAMLADLSHRQRSIEAQLDRLQSTIEDQSLRFPKKALLNLKRKKFLSEVYEKSSSALLRLEEIVWSVKSSLDNKEVLETLKTGNLALREILGEGGVSVGHTDVLLDELADNIDREREFSRRLGELGSSSLTTAHDEEMLEDELLALVRGSELPTLEGLPHLLPGHGEPDELDAAMKNLHVLEDPSPQ